MLSTCAAFVSGFGPVPVEVLLGDIACALGRFFADFKCAGAEFCLGSRILALAPRRLLPPVPTKPPFCAALLTSKRAQKTKLSSPALDTTVMELLDSRARRLRILRMLPKWAAKRKKPTKTPQTRHDSQIRSTFRT